MSAFIEALCHHHRLRNCKTEFAGGLLLERGCGERRCRCAFHRLFRDAFHGEFRVATLLEKRQRLFVGLEAYRQRSRERRLLFGGGQHELRADMVIGLALELLDFALALHNQPHSHALHPSGRQRRLHLAPEHGRELESHQSVEHATCLLCVHKVHVEAARMLDGVENGRLRNLVKHNAVRILLVESEHLAQMPRNGLSLAVFIACEPHLLGLLRTLSQVCNDFFLLLGNLIVGLQRRGVDAHVLLFQVADVAIRRHHLEILP